MIKIDVALEAVREQYEIAKNLKHIKNPVAWALYQVWRYCDKNMRR